MTTEEFSNGFDILLNSYRRITKFDDREAQDTIQVDEYEKSMFLTMAQEDLVQTYYTGRNTFGLSFEKTEEIRRSLDSLVKDSIIEADTSCDITPITNLSKFYRLPYNLLFIVHERAKTASTVTPECLAGIYLDVVPSRLDEINRTLKNPFRQPNDHRVLRLDVSDNMGTCVELVPQYEISDYVIRYVAKPSPIILASLPDNLEIDGYNAAATCTLSEVVHQQILEGAVNMALQRYGLAKKQDV